ncbi:MAG: molecular chaperone TorD family protein [Helicobacteraceae bacterium]|jgi:TorA maturation chaperone TorD|nr:molecular chaperone TorD family protein [Helicobacteraceae bacterium]
MKENLNAARAFFYAALAQLFIYGAAKKTPNETIALLGGILDAGFDKEAANAAKNLKNSLENGGFETLDEEFSELFMSPFGAKIAMSASVYYDGLEAGKPLVAVKEAMNIAALRKDKFAEHEDNFGFVFLLMSKLCKSDENALFIAAGKVYAEVLAPYSAKFLAAVIANPKATIYKDAARLAERFLAFEREFYASLGR